MTVTTTKPEFDLNAVVKIPAELWTKPGSTVENRARVCGREWGPDNRFLQGAKAWVYELEEIIPAVSAGAVVFPRRRKMTEAELLSWQGGAQ